MNENSRRPPKTRRPWLIALAVAALLLSAGRLWAGDVQHPMPRQRIEDTAEIQRLLTDHTLYGRYVGGQLWSEYHSPDGRTAYRDNNCIYAGHWWVADGQVCYRYQGIFDNRTSCFQIYRRGDQLEFDFHYPYPVGIWLLNAYTVDRRPGNPDKMPLEGEGCLGV